MKCHYCPHEPTHVCLSCGVFYCDLHGKFEEAQGIRNRRMRSLCQSCVEQSFKQYKNLAWLFGIWGLGLLIAGGAVTLLLRQYLGGGIFIVQGLAFMYAGILCMARSSTEQRDRS